MSMEIITHRHVHPPTVNWDANGRWLGGIQPSWVSYTEMAVFTEDAYDYILERVHDRDGEPEPRPPYLAHGLGAFPGTSMAIRTGHLLQKKKECMFTKENGHGI